MTAVIACGWILASLAWDRVKPISLDTLPPGAFARLGTARYDGQVRLSPDGKMIAVLPDCWMRNLSPCINIHDAETGKYLRTLHPPVDQLERNSIQRIRFLSATKLLAMSISSNGATPDAFYIFDINTSGCSVISINSDRQEDYISIDCVADDVKLMMGHSLTRVDGIARTSVNVWQTKPVKRLHHIEPLHQSDPWFETSRNGSTLVCGGHNQGEGNTDFHFVQVWDTVKGKERSRIEVGDARKSNHFSLSPNGDRLVVLSDAGLVVYETHSGKQQFKVTYDPGHEDAVVYDHSGDRIVLYQTHRITVFSAVNGKKLQEYKPAYDVTRKVPVQVVFLESGKARARFEHDYGTRLNYGFGFGTEVRDLETGKPLGIHPGHGCPVVTLRFSADGRQLISGGQSTVQLWCKLSDQTLALLLDRGVPQSVLTKLGMLKNKELPYTDFQSEVAKLLNSNEETKFQPLISRESHYQVDVRGMLTWDLGEVNLSNRPLQPRASTDIRHQWELELDGKWRLAWEYQRSDPLPLSPSRPPGPPGRPPGPPSARRVEQLSPSMIVFVAQSPGGTPGGKGIATTTSKAELVARDLKTAKELYRIPFTHPADGWYLSSVQLSPDGGNFVVQHPNMFGGDDGATGNGTFSIYNVETGKPTQAIKLEKVRGVQAAYSPDGSSLLVAARHPEVKANAVELIVMDIKSGKIKSRDHVDSSLIHIQILTDNRSALLLFQKSGGQKEDNLEMQTWDTQTGKVLGSWTPNDKIRPSPAPFSIPGTFANESPVHSKDSSLLAITTRDGFGQIVFIRVFQTQPLKERLVFAWPEVTSFPAHHVEYPTSLAISPDNKMLAVGLTNGTILLYDLQATRRNTPLK